ncbi:MAG: hypothetical protein IKS94_03530 [Prevotella sp.]|nr:hypothetical protein [Prevotella sp.]
MKLKKALTIRLLIFFIWLPPSDHATKQARTIHALADANFPNCLLSVANIGGIHKERTRAESSNF